MSEAGSFLGQDSLLAFNCCYKAAEIVYRGEWIISNEFTYLLKS